MKVPADTKELRKVFGSLGIAWCAGRIGTGFIHVGSGGARGPR